MRNVTCCTSVEISTFQDNSAMHSDCTRARVLEDVDISTTILEFEAWLFIKSGVNILLDYL